MVIGVHTPGFSFEHDVNNIRWDKKKTIRSRSIATMRYGTLSTTSIGQPSSILSTQRGTFDIINLARANTSNRRQ